MVISNGYVTISFDYVKAPALVHRWLSVRGRDPPGHGRHLVRQPSLSSTRPSRIDHSLTGGE